MTISYTQALSTDATIGTTQYAVVLPASAITTSGGAIRLSLHGAANISNAWIGHQGSGALDFDGGQVQLKKAASGSIVLSGVTVLDAVAFALDETKSLVLRFDGQVTGTYKKATGLGSAFQFYYRAGQGGSGNGNNSAGSGWEASASGHTAFITLIEAAASIEEFTGGGSPPPVDPPDDEPAGLGGMAEIMSNQMFASGGVVAGVTGKMVLVSLFNPAASGINAFLRQVVITTDADTLITARSIVNNTGTLLPSRCNLWGDPAAPASKAKVYKSDITAFDGNTAQHDIFRVYAGVPYTVNKTAYPLWGAPPAGLGYSLAVHGLGVGLTAAFHWQEVPG